MLALHAVSATAHRVSGLCRLQHAMFARRDMSSSKGHVRTPLAQKAATASQGMACARHVQQDIRPLEQAQSDLHPQFAICVRQGTLAMLSSAAQADAPSALQGKRRILAVLLNARTAGKALTLLQAHQGA